MKAPRVILAAVPIALVLSGCGSSEPEVPGSVPYAQDEGARTPSPTKTATPAPRTSTEAAPVTPKSVGTPPSKTTSTKQAPSPSPTSTRPTPSATPTPQKVTTPKVAPSPTPSSLPVSKPAPKPSMSPKPSPKPKVAPPSKPKQQAKPEPKKAVSTPAPVKRPTPAKKVTEPKQAVFERTMRPGMKGDDVRALQDRLRALGYMRSVGDGVYGEGTRHAVEALQKVSGQSRDGIAGPGTIAALNKGVLPPVSAPGAGKHIEVDKSMQVMSLIEGGKVRYVIPISSGGGYAYPSASGGTSYAVTPSGDFKVYSIYGTGWQQGRLGAMYRPAYFNGGIAIHGSGSVPPTPASHGCIRVTPATMDWLYSSGWVSMSTRVIVSE